MNNYKLINTHTNEIIKALNDLGYVWTPKKFDEQDCLLKAHWILAEQSGAITYSSGTMIDYPIDFQELTLPQLRDLVVLHRNDVKDANYTYSGKPVLKLATQDYKIWNNLDKCWAEHLGSQTDLRRGIKPIQPEPEQGLISRAEAKLAWAKGEDVQLECHDGTFHTITHNLSLSIFDDEKVKFRLKPRTIKLELEIPAPFEPNHGEEAWCLDGHMIKGYKKVIFDDFDLGLGFWHTEEEIKQVVAAWRGGIKG
ncbi:hypothetical protein [Acinetobacter sp. ANC 3882]|uniref:hypothetical protein n=1 Tax=Acinetobacter sp. ANC 3882 TaxID=2923423 RepID=UPI001F4AC13A|nr:hypothetical protein [Acinetobacter sp. ANC 3882]MCH7312874.1 hypothetical protein [Acinetobacter sp. ANC 3882]